LFAGNTLRIRSVRAWPSWLGIAALICHSISILTP
jgi:hypothetical protein